MMNAGATRLSSAALVLCLLAILALAPASTAPAQDRRTLATKVADILARVPAAGGAERDRLADEMLEMGEAGIAEFTAQLVPAGSGDDTAVRFALSGMAVHASRFGEGEKRAVAERAFASALAAASDPEVRTFLMSQLQLVGADHAVRAAAPHLLDAFLVEPATQLMIAIGNAAARETLFAALGKATGAARTTIIRGLGELRAEDATDQLAALANTPDVAMRKTVLAALARVASPRSYDTLVEAARAADYRYDRANATAALLDYARNLGAKGELSASEKICRLIIETCTDGERLPTSAAALALLVDLRGHDALADLLRAADHPDRAYRNAALLQAERLTGIAPIRRWAAKAEAATPERRAEIIGMLGRQRDRLALPFIRAWLGAPESEVALAAAEALAHVAGPDATVDLLPLLRTRPEGDAPRVAAILLWTIDERHLDPLAAMLDTLSPAAKAAAIGVVGAKGGRRYAGRIFALTSGGDPGVRAAAFGALEGVAGPADVPALLRLLEEVAVPGLARDVQRALIDAARQVEPAQARAAPLVDALETSAHPERLLAVLPQVGGSRALGAVLDWFDRPAPDVKAAAFQALTEWRGPEAADKLYAICAAADAAYRGQAFSGFVRQVSSSSLPADQKLLQLRKIGTLAATTSERRALLRAFERVKTFQSLVAAAPFLDDPELAGDAAATVMRIALPTTGARDGLSGTIVRDALARVLQTLTGPDSEYDKENIRTYLAAMPTGEGFVPLFNSRDLTGWEGLIESPIARAKMSPQELAAKQAEADRRMQANWTVRDGTIVFNGTGDNLCTVGDYRDFELLVDWRITAGGDSGIYLRGTPQVQIWDPARVDVGAEVGSGGLYNNQKHPSKPLVRADNPVGEWNTLRITMIGDKVTVFLNGVKVVDAVTLENYWDRAQPIFASGPIELQAHGTDLAFRDIYVREIVDAEFNLTDGERAEGFVSLFNGRNLAGWIGNTTGYKVERGAIAYDPGSGDRTNLYTAKEYADFRFRFEFQLTPGANSGVGIRAPLEGDAAYVGMEIQVLDDTAPVYAALRPYQYHGSVYGVIPAKRGFLKPVGEWNSEEIVARGSGIQVILNGTVIVDGDILEASREGTIDGQDHPGLRRASGHIGWLSHDTVVRFRNIRIKDLSPPAR